MITLTDKAVSEIKRLQTQQTPAAGESADNGALRVQVIGGGCSGMSYVVDVEKQAMPTDLVTELPQLGSRHAARRPHRRGSCPRS